MVGLSLFNGMGCFEIALIELGIDCDIMYTSEVDKFALQQTRLNFPNNIELGDVRNIDVSKLERIDFLAGGSPCQSFSFAGKRKGMATKCDVEIYNLEKYLELKEQGFEFEGQSYLFWEYMRILTDIRKYNPGVLFLLENVEMGAKWERVLSEAIGVFGVHINSALVSAQNRKRIYWTNIRTRQEGLFGELYSDIPQPKDMGILLKDILESEVDEKYYLSDKMLNYFDSRAANLNNGKINVRDEQGKATTITASCKSVDISDNFVLDTKLKPKENQTKANCFTAGGNSGGLHSDMDLICVVMRGRNPDNSNDRTTGSPTEQRLEPKFDGKTNCLTSVQKDNLIAIGCDFRTDEGIRLRKNGKSGTLAARARNDESCGQLVQENIICHNTMPRSSTTGKGGTGHLSRNDGKTYCLDTGQTNAIEIQTSRIRRLTPSECARLQTIPDWYKWESLIENYYVFLNSETNKLQICEQSAKLKVANQQYQINQQDYAISITYDLLEQEKQKEILLIGQKNVQLKDVIDMQKQSNMVTSALCTIRDFIDINHLNCQLFKKRKDASIVIEKLDMEEQLECVQIIIEALNCMEMHLMLKKENYKQKFQLKAEDILGVRIKKKDTNQQWKVTLAENLKEERLFIILILINWTIQERIYTYAKHKLNIQFCINSLKNVEQNYLNLDISNLKMEDIRLTSDTQQYKMLGNGWTIEVIKHILSFIKNK